MNAKLVMVRQRHYVKTHGPVIATIVYFPLKRNELFSFPCSGNKTKRFKVVKPLIAQFL